jgi:nucleoside 2-deoxyribosyltransferase
MAIPSSCPFCGKAVSCGPVTGLFFDLTCGRCGSYRITTSAQATLEATPIQNRGAVSGYIRRQNSMHFTPNIRDGDVAHLRALTKPPFRERVERYLVAVADKAQTLDQWFKVGDEELVGVSYSDHTNELVIILDHLREEGLLTKNLMDTERLTAKGYIAADELRAKRAASTQAFVAMWFTNAMEQLYEEGFKPGIERAGFAPMLIRNKEHANKIDDEIIAEIRRSAFLVADFTGHRQNVYFETGFAMGLGRRPIWTCQKDDIKNLHFDIRQYNCIDWENATELAQGLQRRIEALFGRGPLAPLA